ncbi:MAG: ATP-binding cassette domain-containing protein [Christiangramia sp.]|uniref:ATP-binding cassette domain-containing protein n=1 Tax=Christiangramia sp. TaxID=1931228 RepID=UPI003241E3C9
MAFHDHIRFMLIISFLSFMNTLHVDSIRKVYAEKVILSDIFLSCSPGEIVGLLGRNGSGKSTLLKIIFGVESSENRFVRIGNKVLQNFSSSSKLINYLPQDHFLPEGLNVKHLISLFLPKSKRKLLLEQEFIRPLTERKVQNLSGGQKRLVEILLLIYSEADYVLLDEPFNGVSPILRESIIQILQQEKRGKGFIITDHDYRNVLKIADRTLLLENACLKEIKATEDLVSFGYIGGNSV